MSQTDLCFNEKLEDKKKNDVFGDGKRLNQSKKALTPQDIFFDTHSIYQLNACNVANGLDLLSALKDTVVTTAFFDPQYRGVMDKLSYGNEGSRQIQRVELSQMPESMIINFIQQISRVLQPTGHLFLWVDKFHLCEGIADWLKATELQIVDLLVWKKMTFGMGYRTRRTSEYCIILQKAPKRAKGVWTIRNIPDVWDEKIINKKHPHQKPFELQKRLIEATTAENDLVLDPSAGSYSVLHACQMTQRMFIGSDLSFDNI